METWQALLLGVVEGITEYLPVSSTGHMILLSHFLGLDDPVKQSAEQIKALEAFEVIIQSGAILAVVWLYIKDVRSMITGILQPDKNPQGRKLFTLLVVGVLPALAIGFLLKNIISTYLFGAGPVVVAMIFGGFLMVRYERMPFFKPLITKSVDGLSVKDALFVGFFQCFAMWPGMSRSMVTILAGLSRGLTPVASAEFSFLLGLPTLLAATFYKLYKDYHTLAAYVPLPAMVIGMVTSGVVAGISIKFLVGYLTKRGLSVFGWYRIGLGAVMALILFGK